MTPKKILAIKLRSLGDSVLMSTPLLEVKKRFPHTEIHVLATVPWVSIFENHPAVTKTHEYVHKEERTARARIIARLAIQLRKYKFDTVLNFHASPSSAMLSYATGAKLRANHFHGHQQKNQYSTVTIPGKGELKSALERDLDTIRAIGVHAPVGLLPKLYPTDSEKRMAQDLFQRRGLSGPVLGMALGASRPTKIWPIERFVDIAIRWGKEKNGGVAVFIGPGEELLAHSFTKGLESRGFRGETPIAQMVGLSVRELMGALSQCVAYLGNDSGPKHVAVALEKPTVTLIGPEDPFEWHDYPKETNPFLYIPDLGCRKDAAPGMPAWCGLQTCIEEKHRCMRLIDSGQAWAELERISLS